MMQNIITTVIAVMLLDLTSGSTLLQQCNLNQRHVNIQTNGAEVILGAIFPIHKNKPANRGCGDFDEAAMQLFEATRWSLKSINDKGLAGNGIKIGIEAWDNCYIPTKALRDTLDFYPEDQSQQAYCNVSTPVLNLGIIGPFTSWSSLAVAQLLSTYPASQISYGAASTELNDKKRYPYFMRTVPSTLMYANNLLSLLRKLNWVHLVVIYTDDSYGMDSYNEFLKIVYNTEICISQAVKILSTDSNRDISSKLNNIVMTEAAGGLMFSPSAKTNEIMGTLWRRGDGGNLQWIVNDLHIEKSSTNPYYKGSLLMAPKSTLITEFRDHWAKLDPLNPPADNPWYREWYMTKHLCKIDTSVGGNFQNLPICNIDPSAKRISNFEQNFFVESIVISLFTFAKAIERAQKNICPSSFTGLCNKLLALSAKDFHERFLQNIDYTFSNSDGISNLLGKRIKFDSHGNIENPEFLLRNYREENGVKKFVEVGNFVNTWNLKSLVFYDNKRNSTLNQNVTSLCPPKGCPICLSPQLKLDIYHIPGDVLIGGIFSIHNQGKLPFTCGSINLEDIQAMIAFRYAIENIKSRYPQILPGISIGAVYSDVCKNSGLIANMLAGFHDEKQEYRDKNSNRLIDPNSVLAYITALADSQATTASNLLGQFKFPQIESKAMAVDLALRQRYPYFSRTAPSEEIQLEVISQILKKNDWTYVQVVSVHKEPVASFKRLIATMSICITAVHMIESENYEEIVSGLRRNAHARVVVVIAAPADINGLLRALKRQKVARDFVLVGTSSWGVSNAAVKGQESAANGSFSLTAIDGLVNSFKQYLDRQDPQSDKIITAWYQNLFDCYLNAGSKGSYIKKCGNDVLTSSPKFSIGSSVYSTINAVYVAASALNRTILHYCGANNGVCSAFRAAGDISGAMILNVMRDITILDDNNNIFTMRNGEGSLSFNIHQFIENKGYIEVGSYNGGHASLYFLPTPSRVVSSCPSFCPECYRINNNNLVNNEAQLMIGAVFGVHKPTTKGSLTYCGEIARKYGYQFVSALEYAVSTVNKKQSSVSLHGIPLGSLILDSCKISNQAFGLMSGVYSGTQQVSNTFKSNYIYAWITETSGSAVQMGKLASKLGVPLLSPAATSHALIDRTVYKTFYRTVSGEGVVANAIGKLCNDMNFNYIQVVLSRDVLSEISLKVFELTIQLHGVCIIAKHRFSQSVSAADIMNSLRKSMSPTVLFVSETEMEELLQNKLVPGDENLVFITPEPFVVSMSKFSTGAKNLLTFEIKPTIDLTSYIKYMQSLRPDENNLNGFFEEYYQNMFECDLLGSYKFGRRCPKPFKAITESSKFSVDSVVSSTVNAVYVMAQALDMTLQQLCGVSYTTICYEFYVKGRLPEYLLTNLEHAKVNRFNLSPGFQFVNREGSSTYNVIRYDGTTYQEVGTYNGAVLQMNDISKHYSSVFRGCLGKCDNCIQQKNNFMYIPGDILLGGIFDVHGSGPNLFSCGNINLYNGFQNLEAFIFAIEAVNKNTSLLNGVKLGGIGLDSCNSDVMAGNLVMNLYNGMLKVTNQNVTFNSADIYAYIGGGTSDVSVYMDRIIRTMQIPLVGYASTTSLMNDKYAFPNFLRTIPSDDRLAKAIVKFLKRHNIPYIQIIYSSSSFGTTGAELFKQLALENKICVAQSIQFIDRGISVSDSANNVMKALLNKPLANTVIIFAEVLYIRELFKVLKQEPKVIRENYKFIGSGSWGYRKDVIKDVEDVAVGSVSIAVDSSDIHAFHLYLDSKTLEYAKKNPWFAEYYEGMFDCYLSNPKVGLVNRCTNTNERVVSSKKYFQDNSVLSVVNSVYAVAHGLHKTLIDICGPNYKRVCNAFKGANINYQLFNNIKAVQFQDAYGKLFRFNDEGDGNRGYKFFQLQRIQPLGYTYREVARVDNNGSLTDARYTFIPQETACKKIEACSECFIYQEETVRYAKYPDLQIHNMAIPVIVGVFDVHAAGQNLLRCGEINVAETLHLIAFFDTIQRSNDANPSQKIAGLALDTCGHPLHVDQDAYSLLSSGKLCHTVRPIVNKNNIFSFFTMHEDNTVAANRVLPYFKVSYLSPDLNDVRFDDLNTYQYLFRSKGSMHEKVTLVSRVLKTKGISPVAVVYSNDPTHNALLETFKEESTKDGICIEEILRASDNVFNSQSKRKSTRAIVLLTNLRDGLSILRQTKNTSSENSQTYLFIGAEDWMKNVITELSSAGEVSLLITERKFNTIEPFVSKIKDIDFKSKVGLQDIWFKEFYQKLHNCSLKPSQYKTCNQLETVTEKMIANIDQTAILSTIAGTYALIKSTQEYTQLCNGPNPPTGCNLSTPNGRARFWSTLNEVEYKTNETLSKPTPSLDFKFSKQVWSPGYELQELYRKTNGIYSFQPVATSTNGVLKPTQPSFKTVTEKVLQSILFCPGCQCLNQPKMSASNKGDTSSLVGGSTLVLKESTIRNYFHFNDEDVLLYDWPLWAIILAALTTAGIFFTLLLFFSLLIMYPIRGGTTILGFVFVIGVLGIYGVNFAFFFQADPIICAARRFTMGVVYAICFACLCVKAVDNWRCRTNEIDSHDYRRLSSSLALCVITLVIILIQVLLNTEWLILVKPSAVTLYPSVGAGSISSSDSIRKLWHDYNWCAPSDSYDTGLALSFVFIFLLDFFAIYFGSLLWDNDKNYYESRWIVVACLCSSSCFLVWMVVSTIANPVFRDPAVAIGNFINATAFVVVMPLRKIILLLRIKKEQEKEKKSPYSTIYDNINKSTPTIYTANSYH